MKCPSSENQKDQQIAIDFPTGTFVVSNGFVSICLRYQANGTH